MNSKYGNPVGAPDYRPLNPWGRGFPKRPPKPDMSLWVCNVLDRQTGQRVNIGLCGPRDGAQMLADAVRKANEGNGRPWAADPQVVRVFR